MPVSVTDIVEALSLLGGRAHLSEIERVVREIATPPLPPSTANIIRGRLQEFSSDALSYGGGPDLFRSVHGVEARQGIWALREDQLNPAEPDTLLDPAEADVQASEGRATLRKHLRRERSKKLVTKFKQNLKHFRCSVCDFDFEQIYGELGSGFIEAHHTIPVALLEPGQATSTADLVAVCSNCHRMLHRNGLLDWRDLKTILGDGTMSRSSI